MLKAVSPFSSLSNRAARGFFDLWVSQELGEEIPDSDESHIPKIAMLIGAKKALQNNQRITTRLLTLYGDVAIAANNEAADEEARVHQSLLASALLKCTSHEKGILFPENNYWEKFGKQFSSRRYDYLLCHLARDEEVSTTVRIQSMRLLQKIGNNGFLDYNWERILKSNQSEIEQDPEDLTFIASLIDRNTEYMLDRPDPKKWGHEARIDEVRCGIESKINLLEKLSSKTILWPSLATNINTDLMYCARFNRPSRENNYIIQDIFRQENLSLWQHFYKTASILHYQRNRARTALKSKQHKSRFLIRWVLC